MRRFAFRSAVISGAALAVLAIFFFTVYQPWQLNWGAADEEVRRQMSGDQIVRDPTFNATRAVTIRGRPEDIWPWIVQIGYRKAGFYSYDRLDNDGIPSATRIIPEYQSLRVGDTIPLSRTAEAEVRALESDRFLLMVVESRPSSVHGPWTWAWGLYPQDAQHTRLVTRLRVRREGTLSNLFLHTFEIVMMRKCLLGLKRRVEASSPE